MMIQKIYVISLETEEKRRKKFKLLNKDLPYSILEWFIVKKHKNGGRAGCFESHVLVTKKAIKDGYKNILILEDDAKFLKPWNEIEQIVNLALINVELLDKEWKYLGLGINLSRSFRTSFDNLLQVKCGRDTHAYIPNLQNWKELQFRGNDVDVDLFCNGRGSGLIRLPYSTVEALSRKFHVYQIRPYLVSQEVSSDSSISTQLENLKQAMFVILHGNDNVNELSTAVNTNDLAIYIGFLIIFAALYLIAIVLLATKQKDRFLYLYFLTLFFLVFLIVFCAIEIVDDA